MSTQTIGKKSRTKSHAPQQGTLSFAFSLDPWKAGTFLILSFAFGVAAFVTLVTLIATGVGLIVTIVGIPLLAATMLLWPFFARAERIRVKLLTGIEIPDPYQPLPDGSLVAKGKAIVRDGAVWRDLVYLLLLFPIGIAEFVLTVVAVTVPVTLLFAPVIVAFDAPMNVGRWHIETVIAAIPFALIGAVLMFGTAHLLMIVARGHGLFARWLLGPSGRAQLEARVETLTRTRSRMLDVTMEERRSIERDLHDGAQQRLVALAMNLGMAKEKFDADPEAARALIDEAHDHAKLALADIRNIVRGIHPAVLTDRGLDAAISALAGQCPASVTVDVALPERPPEAIETTAYFIVAEALTNVAKHSNAESVEVSIKRTNDALIVEVVDDGNGGATLTAGGGLAGLRDRVETLDGAFTVASPAGGPTRIHAELPCGS